MAEGSGYRLAFAVGEFRALWLAEALSQLGDQLARVALTVLVFQRTDSAALSALAFGLSTTPSLIGSALLSGLADRYRRREVMIGCDAVSTVLVLLMAVPGMPLAVTAVATAGVALIGGPFRAARLALLPEMLEGEAYVAALASRLMTIQIAQLAGYAVGGVVVALIGPHSALLIDAVTFAVSAIVLRSCVRDREAAQQPAARSKFWSSSARGVQTIAYLPGMPALFALGMLAGLYVGPEGLAAAWAAEIGAPDAAVGLIMAASPGGLVIGAWSFTRYVGPSSRPRWVGPLAIGAGAVLAVCAVRPALWLTLILLVLSGMFMAYQIEIGAAFGISTPADGRAQVMGLLNSSVLTAQGVGVVLGGLLAGQFGVARAVAVAGAAGSVFAVCCYRSLRKAQASGSFAAVRATHDEGEM